jgi:RHS repeat-associated protein
VIFERRVTDDLPLVWQDKNLKEIKSIKPGSTITIQYTHGAGLDQPLSLIRTETGDSIYTVRVGIYPYWDLEVKGKRTGIPQQVFLHRNSRGDVFTATGMNGAECCTNAFFPGDEQKNAHFSIFGIPAFYRNASAWYGSLVTGSIDQSGLKYMRNRYYNPETGQFTQPDPIGIAGGLNVYGYAAGDPVNYRDPFGLKVCAENSRLRRGIEDGINATINWDEDGCVSDLNNMVMHGGSEWRDNQDIFSLMVSSMYVFSVKTGYCTSGKSCFDPGTREARLNLNDSSSSGGFGQSYAPCGFWANITLSVPRYNDAQLIVHELLGHGGGMVGPTGRANGNHTSGRNSPTFAAENRYNRAVGRMERCR